MSPLAQLASAQVFLSNLRDSLERGEAPNSMGGGYVNMIMDEGEVRVKAAYRDNYTRLAQVKAKYDPHNLFHVNQNIKPAALSKSRKICVKS